MAFEKARTSLNDIEDRIRRFFGAAGTIGLDFKPEIIPVAAAGDLYAPGNSTFRGRRWIGQDSEITAANWVIGIQAQVPVVITGISNHSTVAGAFVRVAILHPGTNVVFNQQTVAWQERPASVNDWAPLLATAAGAGVVPTNAQFIDQWLTWTNGQQEKRYGIMLPAGYALVCYAAVAAGTQYFTFQGYVY